VTTHEGMAADWYEDPTKVGDLRYYDGTQWTDHVTINGEQTTAPYEPAPSQSFSMTRAGQWRTEDEKALEVMGPGGQLGRYVTILDGAPGYRFEDARGGTVLSVAKPSLKNAVEVADPAGYKVGTITKIGRLHSRYDIASAEGQPVAVVRLVPGATDEWALQVEGAGRASITRTRATPADALNLAEVEYDVVVTGPVDNELQRMLLAVPVAIDILDTQAF